MSSHDNKTAERTRGRRRLALLAFSLVLMLNAKASEPPHYRFDNWQVESGLPQSSVTSVVQTRDGYLWVGTFNGLARFDGIQFKVFRPNGTPRLPSSRIVQLYEDRQGVLWISGEEGSLARYVNGQFESCKFAGGNFTPGYILAFAEPGDGAVWMSTSEGRLLRWDRGELALASNDENRPGHVVGLAAGEAGQAWVATTQGLVLWTTNGFAMALRCGASESMAGAVLARSRRGGCWVAFDGKLARFNGSAWVDDRGAYPWSKGGPYCMLEDRDGQLWVGTYGSGLYCYSTNGSLSHFSSQDGLPGNLLRSLFQDQEGSLWIGTEGDGLARLKPATFQVYGRAQGLSGDCVLSVSEGNDGELWIGTNGDGVNRLHHGVVRHYGPQEGLLNECVWCVLQDRNNTVWSGTWGGGLYRMQDDRFVPVSSPAISSPIVCALYEDHQGTLWEGQQRSELELTQWRDGRASLFKLKHHLERADIRSVVEDRTGNLWIGSNGNGLYRLQNGRETHFGKAEGLSSEFIRSLCIDQEGVLWIGTYGGGLDRLEGEAIQAFTTRDGLPSDALCYITDDSRGNLWCGSLGGIFRLNKEELTPAARAAGGAIHCVSYTTVDGLPSLECSGGSQPSGCKTRDGRLWFPTVRGLAVVDPEHVPVNPIPPPVVIEEVALEGRGKNILYTVPAAHHRQDPGSRPAEEPLLKIAPGLPRLEFRYTGLSLVAPRKVRFQYRLKGLEDDWVDAGTRRAANYSYLPPGNYEFWVRACNNDGIWNQQGAVLAMIVLPHIWQAWWFRVLALLAVGLVFAAVYELRLASARKMERLRLRIARDLHDEVGSNLGSIALLSEVIGRPSERPLREIPEIRRIAVQTIGALRDIVWFLDPASDSMEELMLRMRETANMMLPGVPFEFSATGASGAPAPSLELRRNLFPIFKEILHNIAKHAGATQVRIEVAIVSRRFELRVSDNGKGFDPSIPTAGHGLKNLRRRTAELEGTLDFRSVPGQGTSLRLVAPLTRTRGWPRRMAPW